MVFRDITAPTSWHQEGVADGGDLCDPVGTIQQPASGFLEGWASRAANEEANGCSQAHPIDVHFLLHHTLAVDEDKHLVIPGKKICFFFLNLSLCFGTEVASIW